MPQVGEVNRFGSTLDAIAEIGREESAIAMQKQAKSDFTEGVIAVTQGATLKQIEKDEPWYNNVFGPSATLRGAEAQTAVAGINEYFAEEAAFLTTDEGRGMSPDVYRQRQGESLKTILTGNNRVDEMLTADITPKMGALAETHMKANRAYVNEQNVLTVSNRILGESQNVNSLARSNGWDHDLTGEAKAVLGASLSNPPEGMNAGSWRKMLVESVVVDYKQGSEVMHRSVDGLGIKFSPTEQLRILEAQRGYASQESTDINLEAENAWGKIAAGVDEGIVGPAELQRQMTGYENAYGDLKQRGSRALFRKAWARNEEQISLNNDAQLVLQGRIGELTGKNSAARKQGALEHAYTLIDNKYPQTVDGKQAARRDKITLWSQATGSVQDTRQKSRFTYLTDGVLESGKVDPRYTAMFTDWMDYAQANPVKALDMIAGDEAKAQAETIFSLLQEGSVQDIQSAVLMVDTQRKRNVDSAYLSSDLLNTQIAEQVESIAESKWSWFGFQSPQDAVANSSAISGFVTSKAKQLVAKGYSPEVAVVSAAKTFARNHDIINGQPLYNAGDSLAARMNLVDGSPEAAINFHMQALGFEQGEFRVEGMQGDSLIISTADPDNPDYAAGLNEISINHIGMNFNNTVVLPPLEAAVVSATKEVTEDAERDRANLRRRKQALGIFTGTSNAELDAEIERNIARQNEANEFWRKVISGGLTLGQNPNLLN
jgi:hypothetical protein